jgi:hypothetical protein
MGFLPEDWLDKADVWGERVFRGRFLQQFAALFYKNGKRRRAAAMSSEQHQQQLLAYGLQNCDPAQITTHSTVAVLPT